MSSADEASSEAPVSKAEFARRHGLSRGRVTQLAKQGLPVRGDGKIDPSAGDAWLADNLDSNKRKAGGGEDAGAQADKSPRAAKDAADAKLKELELARRQGQLIEREAARQAVFRRARVERDAWMSWVTRIAPALATELGVREDDLFAVLDREVRNHLETLADQPLDVIDDDGDR